MNAYLSWYLAVMAAIVMAVSGATGGGSSSTGGTGGQASSSPAPSTSAAPTTPQPTPTTSTPTSSTPTSTAPTSPAPTSTAPATLTSTPTGPAPTTTATPTTSPSPSGTTSPSTTSPGTTSPGGTAADCGGQRPAKAGGGTWTCSFDDEFDGTTLDTTKWSIQQTSNSGFDEGGACYTDSPDNVSVTDGTLNLTVRNEGKAFTCASSSGNYSTHYTSGMVTTLNNFSQTYGRFEVRAQLPAAAVKGLQETFWLWPNNALKYGTWPASGEIDFAEFYSQYAGSTIPYLHYNLVQSTVNWATNTNVYTALPGAYAQPGMDCTIDQSAYNTYTVTWLPGQITVQVNGHDCLVDNYSATGLTGAAPFDQPFFLALTQALGSGGNAPTAATPLPATTHVDYVRAWR